MWDGQPFSGAKIALLCGTRVVAYLRDAKDGIPFPNLWDLPGGGREGDEGPADCALRELREEFGIRLSEERITSILRYRGLGPSAADTYFCAAPINEEELEQVEFGEEGQRWCLMDVSEFIGRGDAVPQLQQRLLAYLTGAARDRG